MLAAPVCRQLLSNVIRSISGGNIPTDAKRPKSRKELRLMHYFQGMHYSHFIFIDTPTKYDIGHSKIAFYAKVIKYQLLTAILKRWGASSSFKNWRLNAAIAFGSLLTNMALDFWIVFTTILYIVDVQGKAERQKEPLSAI